MASTDDLRTLSERAETILSARGRKVVRGVITTPRPAFVDLADDDSLLNALDGLATHSDCVLALEEFTLTSEFLEDAADAAGPDSPDDARAIRSARTHVGHIAVLEIHCLSIASGKHTVLRRSAEWYDALPIPLDDDAADSHDSEGDFGLFGRGGGFQERERLPDEAVKRFARLVAETETFQSSSGAMMQRRAAAEAALEALNETVPEHEMMRISQEAGKIWDFDIRPKLNASIRPRAVELLNQGLSKAKIAAALGIPVKRLAEIL